MNYSLDDTEWFAAFKEGDQRAFNLVFKTYKKRIYNYSIAFLNNELEAEEITLDTFLALWKECRTIENPTHILKWLYFDSKRRCISALRKPRIINEEFDEDRFNIPSSESKSDYERIHAGILVMIDSEVEMLPEQMKLVFMLRFGKKLPPQEVAAIMGIKVNSVYVYTNIALQKLRLRLLDHWLEGLLCLLTLLVIN